MLALLRISRPPLQRRPHVRPWAMSAPIVVLILCLPMLRPLRHPTEVSDDEAARLGTVEALVEHGTLAIEHTDFAGTADKVRIIERRSAPSGPVIAEHYYSKHPPVMSFLLAGPYWVMYHLGLSFSRDMTLATYLLTLMGVTLPVAMSAGMLYKMGRLFELRRPWRASLALATVCASGLISYGTVLNSHASAAALILAACACLFHVAVVEHPARNILWILLAGLCASLAAVIDLAAPVFLLLLVFLIVALRWPIQLRLAGLLLYVLGALPPIVLHAALTLPATGDLLPGFVHDTFPRPPVSVVYEDEPDDDAPHPLWERSLCLAGAVFGAHGMLSHFPVLAFGLAGMGMVLHRHWPSHAKTLAIITALGAATIIGIYVFSDTDWTQPMFAARWFVLFLPLVLFWAGAWVRKRHHPATWAVAGVVLAFSIATSLLGALDPVVPAGPGEYTAYAAAKRLVQRDTGLSSRTLAGERP